MALVLDEGDLAWVRQYVGDEPDEETLNDLLNVDEVGTREELVRRILNGRLANFLNRPERMDIPGQYSDAVGANIKGLQDQLKGLPTVAAVTDDGSVDLSVVVPCLPPR